jgi:hypothetical protein
MMDARQLLSISRFPPGRAIWCRLTQGNQPTGSLAIETAASATASRSPRMTAAVTSLGRFYQPPRDGLRRTDTIAHKDAVLSVLPLIPAAGVPVADLYGEWRIEWEERAAIMEFDGSLSREQAEAQALADRIMQLTHHYPAVVH